MWPSMSATRRADDALRALAILRTPGGPLDPARGIGLDSSEPTRSLYDQAVFSPYRRVLALPGALAMSMSGLVARLPISMIGLGLVVLISGETGSYSLAGAVTASYIVASSVCAIIQ